MTDYYSGSRAINGTFGEVWVGDEYIADITSLEAKVSIEKSDVQVARKLTKSKKVTGMSGSGTIKTNKTRSYFMNLISNALKTGKDTSVTITSKLEDPDALGTEEVVLKNCSFDELSLVNFEGGKLGEESIPFTFDDWDIKQSITTSWTKR
jgi:hypothetical protein